MEAGDYAAARAKYQAGMVDLEAEYHPAILVAIANSYAAEGDAAGRMRTLEQARTLAPADTSVLLALARANYDAGDVDSAIANLQKVLEVEPDNATVLQVLADMLVAEGRVEEAQQYIARLPEGTKLDPNALLNVGIDHYNAGELDAALERFDEVVKNYPELPTALYYRGLVYLGQGKNDLAAADLEAFLAAEPDSPKAAEAREFLAYLNPEE
jgi:tetratricopeptide (TPR) repeat protein